MSPVIAQEKKKLFLQGDLTHWEEQLLSTDIMYVLKGWGDSCPGVAGMPQGPQSFPLQNLKKKEYLRLRHISTTLTKKKTQWMTLPDGTLPIWDNSYNLDLSVVFKCDRDWGRI